MMMIFPLQMRKLKFRKVATCHEASNWQCQYLASNLSASRALHFWHFVTFQLFERIAVSFWVFGPCAQCLLLLDYFLINPSETSLYASH